MGSPLGRGGQRRRPSPPALLPVRECGRAPMDEGPSRATNSAHLEWPGEADHLLPTWVTLLSSRSWAQGCPLPPLTPPLTSSLCWSGASATAGPHTALLGRLCPQPVAELSPSLPVTGPPPPPECG